MDVMTACRYVASDGSSLTRSTSRESVDGDDSGLVRLVSIRPDARVDRVSLAAMESLLRVELGKSESGRVVFRGDKDVSYGVFSKVMEAARRAGARKFDLAQSPGEKNEGPNGK